jgi:endonuclease G, mitochondrial
MSIIRFNDFQNMNDDLVDFQQERALQRYIERSGEREHVASELQTKNPFEISKPERVAVRKAIIDPRDGLALERIIEGNDLVPVFYLEAGLKATKPVCRIEVRDSIGRILGHGTGFLVSPSLLLTNNHVLKDEDSARFSLAQFNYELDLNLKERDIKNFRLMPERLFMTNQELDFTLVSIEEVSSEGAKVSEFGFLPLIPQKGKVLKGEHVSIIQHPFGAPKVVALRENKVTDIFDDYIHYETDTDVGASGSAVFNDEWMVVGLHHAGVPNPNDKSKFIANEGIRISSIVQFIMKQYPNLSGDKKKLIDGISAVSESLLKKVSVGTSNEWNENSTGYDSKFLGNSHEIPHPKLRTDLEQDVALQENGGKILNYTHFSIVMSKSRRLAYYTVVNIDGKNLKSFGREDNWQFDSRIDEEHQCGNELYDGNDLDRGHLVRRRDPVWGESAAEANKDTFHFTNCSPQHKGLNQQTWLGLEDYILKNAEIFDLKVTVFTGPIFRSDDMLYRGVQIPAEFWKVVAMVKEDGNLSATAYLQSQKNLIKDLEFAYGEYKTYQVAISTIEDLTGIDFGDLRNHDPFPANQLESTVGHIIHTYEDIVF